MMPVQKNRYMLSFIHAYYSGTTDNMSRDHYVCHCIKAKLVYNYFKHVFYSVFFFDRSFSYLHRLQDIQC